MRVYSLRIWDGSFWGQQLGDEGYGCLREGFSATREIGL